MATGNTKKIRKKFRVSLPGNNSLYLFFSPFIATGPSDTLIYRLTYWSKQKEKLGLKPHRETRTSVKGNSLHGYLPF